MTTFEDGSIFPYRVSQLEKRVDDVYAWRPLVDQDRRDLSYVRQDMAELNTAVSEMKKIITRAAVTVATSAIMGLVSVLIATGHTP